MGYFRFKVGDKIKILPQYVRKYIDWVQHQNDIGIITYVYAENPSSEFDYTVRWLNPDMFSTSSVTHNKIIGAAWAELPQINEQLNKYKMR